jgi:sulfoxide reductase heme-binding subunit YedZ
MPAWTCAASTEPTARTTVNRLLLHPAAKPLVLLLAMTPFALLVQRAFSGGLGPNPAETVIRSTGDWTLWLLLVTLAVTPLRVTTGWTGLARFRRMLGLSAAFYGLWHALAFTGFDMGFDLAAIVRDIAKRPFILVGTAALLLMLPLAATSFDAAIRWLGARRWKALHRLVYATALLGLLHLFWMRTAKNRLDDVAVHALVLALLLGWRVWHAARQRRRRAAAAAAAATPPGAAAR